MTILSIISKQNDIVGKDVYRKDDPTVPVAFRPIVEMSAAPNPRQTSNTMTVRSINPLVTVHEGVTKSNDSFVMSTKFTSLQHVTNNTERAAIFDSHIAFLQAARTSMLEGRLPLAPLTFA